MYKTYYMSLDHGETFRRYTRNKSQFTTQMWARLTRELYPLSELYVCNKTLEINIREPKDMREILTVFIHRETTLEQLWETIKELWDEIDMNC